MSSISYGLKRILFVILVLFVSIPVFSQTESDDWYMNKVISEVTFEGLASVKKSELTGVTNKYIGRQFTDELYNEIYERLYAMSLFEDIEPYAKHDPKNSEKVILVFSVKEYPVISSIDFRGNKKIRNNELRDTVSMKTGDVFVESAALVDERALRDLYISKGYSAAKVSYKTEEKDGGIKVSFVISEGSNTVIKTINFSGNTVFSSKTLKGKLSLKEVGFLKDGAFQRSSLETDKQTLVNYYMTKGYIDARIVDVLQDTSFNQEKDRDEITLTFVIQEGAQYTYNGTTLSGNEIFSTEKLLSFIKLNVGDVFNQTKYQEGVSNLTNLYYENGYMTTDFSPSINKDSERRTVSYSINITERSRAHVENIIVKGNTKTKDNVILREIPLKPGDVFSREKIMAGMRNLYNLQYFSSIVPEPVSGSEENLVDLVINVEEQSTTSLQFGATFSGVQKEGDFPISLFFKLQNSNLKGEGKTISTGVNIATDEFSVDLSYGQTWLFDKPIQLSESLSFSTSDESALMLNPMASGAFDNSYYYMGYKSISATLGTTLGRRWTPNFAVLTLTGGMANTLTSNAYSEELFVPLDSGVNKSANSVRLKDSLFVAFSLDGRDLNYEPSKGWFASQRLAWYGLIPAVEKEFYLRTETKAEGYLTLFDIPCFNGKWNFKSVLATYAGLSCIFPVPGTLFSDSSKVYVDGMFNGRGWTEVSSRARGRAMLSTRAELRFPVVPGMIGLDFFMDGVAVKNNVDEIFTSLSIEDFYFSFGPGLRFLLPQFPLHLLFANKFRVSDNEVQWNDTWRFVLSFNITNK